MNLNDSEARKKTILLIFFIVGIIFALRLFYIQVIQTEYRLSAENNVLRYVTQYPARGLIYDRNGKLMVFNEAVYDLMVLPNQVQEMDTLELCGILEIPIESFRQKLQEARKFSRYKPSLFERQLPKETYGFLEEKLYRFPGFFVQSRTLRKYEMPIAAHLLGYIGEVPQSVVDNDAYYKSGDYIGISGVEKSYEVELRGHKGVNIKMVDVHNREVGSYEDGRYDTASVMGSNLNLSLDADLQTFGEELMVNKKGSVVAIEPSTGEVLVFISSPTYDPNLLVGRVRGRNFVQLNKDPVKPLLNRAMGGQYPPGSTFKMMTDLVGLAEGTLTPSTRYGCAGRGSYPIRCTHSHRSPADVLIGLEQSCNPFHWHVFRTFLNEGKYGSTAKNLAAWQKHLNDCGFGHKVGIDLSFELNGNVPTVEFYDKIYGAGRWNAMTIRSLSIGQGEVLATPIQLANYAAAIANRGFYYKPHVVKSIGEGGPRAEMKEKISTNIASQYFDIVACGMEMVTVSGTARSYKIEGIPFAGKTGTAENPHGKDHALFVGFAPVVNPKIAIAVVVENSGFGSTWAVPIAGMLMEKYLTGEVKNKVVEERIKKANLL